MNSDSPRSRRGRAAPGRRTARVALRSQVRATVRSAIVDAAEALIAERGLHAATLAGIARRAGVAVGTIYNYFTDRDDLVRGLFEARRAVVRPAVLAAATVGAGLPFEPRLRRAVRELLAVFEAHRRFVKVAIETEHLKVGPSTALVDLRQVLEAIVAAGVAEGVVSPAHAALLPLVVAGALRALVLQRSVDGGSFVDDADALVALVLDGARRRA